MIKHKALLRLRKDKKTTLTYKSSPPPSDKDFKIFKALEIDISDFSTMNQIHEALGFHIEQKYEKWRETFVLDSSQFCLDSMPIGEFLEIELLQNRQE